MCVELTIIIQMDTVYFIQGDNVFTIHHMCGINNVDHNFRYHAIKSPFSYDVAKVKSKLVIVFILAWFIGLTGEIPTYMVTKLQNNAGRFQCISLMLSYEWIGISIVALLSLLNVIIPSGTMLYVYIRMGLILYTGRSMNNDSNNTVGSARNTALRKANSNILQTCILLFLFYIITYGYHYAVFSVYVLGDYHDFRSVEWFVAWYLLTLNSWLNPFIYALR